MSSAGRAGSSSGCVTRPKGRETGLRGFAVPIQLSSLTGSYVMATAEHREPYESSSLAPQPTKPAYHRGCAERAHAEYERARREEAKRLDAVRRTAERND
jgi:hypothetical protein